MTSGRRQAMELGPIWTNCKPRVTQKSPGSLRTAACKFANEGAMVPGIKGAGGFAMERSDIEIECSRRKSPARI